MCLPTLRRRRACGQARTTVIRGVRLGSLGLSRCGRCAEAGLRTSGCCVSRRVHSRRDAHGRVAFSIRKGRCQTYSSTQFVGSLRLAHSLIRAPIARHTRARQCNNYRVRLLVAGPTRPCKRQCGCPVSVETWLILPVVIRLSQRLSHACLSISIIQ